MKGVMSSIINVLLYSGWMYNKQSWMYNKVNSIVCLLKLTYVVIGNEESIIAARRH